MIGEKNFGQNISAFTCFHSVFDNFTEVCGTHFEKYSVHLCMFRSYLYRTTCYKIPTNINDTNEKYIFTFIDEDSSQENKNI